MGKIEIEGLKGLNIKDRDEWLKEAFYELKKTEPTFNYNIDDVSEEDKTLIYFNSMFKEKFGDRSDYNVLKTFNDEEAVNFWNTNYETEQNIENDIINRYTVESGDSFGINSTKASPDRDFGRLIAGDKSTEYDNDSTEFDFNMLPKFEDLFSNKVTESSEEEYFNQKIYKDDEWYYYNVDKNSKNLRNFFDDTNYKRQTYEAYKNFDKIADSVSNIYKNFKNSDALGLTFGDVKDVMSNYYSILGYAGEDEANIFLNNYMQDRLAKNQSFGEKLWNGFKGMGASAVSSAVMLYGVADAIFSGEAFNSEDYNENVGIWANFWNKVINNDITRYANDILKYQSYKKEDIKALKERGLVGNIYKTVQEEQGSLGDKIWSINFIPDMIQQHGFTVTSAFVSFGTSVLSKGIGGLSKVAKEGTKAIIKKEAKDLSTDVVKQFFKEGAKKGEAIGGFFGAGLAGTSEAVMNSLDVNDSVYQEGLRLINEKFGITEEDRRKKFEEWMQEEHSDVYQQFQDYSNSKNTINLEQPDASFDILKSKFEYYWEEYNKTYLDRVEELKASVIRAQNTAFAINQTINGFLNAGLKAAALHPSVKKLGKKSKSMFGLDDAGNVVNPSKLKKTIKVGWKTIEEAVGEGIEELSTEVVGGYTEKAGISDFELYLQNRVGTYGKDATDRAFAASLIGADALLDGAWGKLTDANSWYAFVSGAASSSISIGNPIGLYNAYTISKDNPNLSKADKYKLWSSAFLRSSFVENYKSAVGELQREKNHVEELSKFIKDPQNLKLYNNAIEVTNFSIQRNLSTNSELEYRNSNLGTTIATINALEDIKEYNPHLYRTHITNLRNLANLSNTDENFKKEQIDAYRSLNLVSDNTTDEEIIERISKNAIELQNFRKSVIENREKVKEIHGENLDSDVLNSLVFGEITYENYGNRINQMNEEINQSYNKGKTNLNASVNPEDAETLTNEEKQHLIKYGNQNESRKLQNRLNEEIEDLEYKIFKLEKNKSEAKKNSKKLKDLKSQLESKQQELKDFNKSFDKVKDSLTDKKLLTGDDIMSLSNEDRAYVMSKEFYDKSSYDQASILDYLNKVFDAGDNYPSNKSTTKIQDVGKLEKSRRLHEDVRKMSRRSLTNYAQTVKYNSYDNMSKQSVESLKDVKDYKDFKKLYYGLVNNSNQLLASFNRKNVKNILKDNEHYKTLQNSQKLTRLYFNKLVQALNNESIIKNLKDNGYPVTDETHNKFLIMASYLSENNIDIKDVNNINRMLTFERLNEYFNNLSEITERLYFDAKDVDAFKKIINNAREEVQQIEDINKPVEVTKVDNSQTVETESLFNDPTIVVYDDTPGEKITDVDTDLLNKSDEDIIKHLAEIIKNNQLNVTLFRPMIKKCFHNTEHRQESLSLLIYCINNDKNIDNLKIEDLANISSETNISLNNLNAVKDVISGFQIDNTGRSINGEPIDNTILNLIDKYLSNNNQQNDVKKPQIDISYQNKQYNLPILDLDDEDVKNYGVVDFLNNVKDPDNRPITFIGNKDNNKIYVCVYIQNKKGRRQYIKNNYQVISIIPAKQNADESNNNYTQNLLNDLRSKFQSYGENNSFFEIESDKKFTGFRIYSNAAKHSTNEQYTIQEQLDNSKTVKEEDFIKNLVNATQQYDSKTKTVKISYDSPANGETVTVEKPFNNDDNSRSKTDRDLLLYVSPKQTPKTGPDNGETIIEIFVKSLKDYKFNNDESVLEFFKNGSAESFASKNQPNTVFYKYFETLSEGLNTLKELNYNLTGDEFQGYDLDINSKNTLDDKVKHLNNRLKRYLNLSNYEYGYEINNNEYIDLVLKDSEGKKVTGCNIHFYKFNEKPDEKFKITDDSVFNFFKNCIIDNGKLRENDKGEILYKFQVDYSNINTAKKGYESKSKIDDDKTQDEKNNELNLHITESLIREGILFSNKNTLDRQNISVTLYSTASKQQTKKPQNVTVNGTEAKDMYTEESKPIFDWGQNVNGKIEDIKNRLEQFLFDKNHINNNDNNHNNSTRSVTSTIYNSSIYYDNDVSKEVGNIYDRAIRRLINDKTVTTEQVRKDFGFSEEELNKIIEIVNKLKSEFPGYILDAREFKIEFTDENGEQLIGIPDIIAYNSDGEIVIIDIKTINGDSDLIKETNWKTQVNKYGYGLNQIVSDIGAEVKKICIVKIPVKYDDNVQLIDGELKFQGELYNSSLKSEEVEILTSEYSSKSPDVTEGLTENISLDDEMLTLDIVYDEFLNFDDNLDSFMPSDNLTEFENKQRTDCA